MREILLPDSDEDAPISTTLSPPSFEHSPKADLLLYSNPDGFIVNSESLQHPPLLVRQQLFSIYCENVDPLFKIIHRPTVQSQLEQVGTIVQHDVKEAGTNALLFAIYAAAVMTLPDIYYASIANETKSDALSRYIFAVEYSLIKSKYIQSQSIIPMQAFTIYLVSVE